MHTDLCMQVAEIPAPAENNDKHQLPMNGISIGWLNVSETWHWSSDDISLSCVHGMFYSISETSCKTGWGGVEVIFF